MQESKPVSSKRKVRVEKLKEPFSSTEVPREPSIPDGVSRRRERDPRAT